jgi:hypothetical protein
LLGADGITVTMELRQLIGLQRLLQAERAVHGPAWLHHQRRGGRGWDQLALGWRYRLEDEGTMEWLALPFATVPEPEGHED